MDRKTEVTPPPWASRGELLAFFDELRRCDYDITPARCVAAQDLVLSLAARGVALDRPERVCSLLAPVLCSKPAEQADFSRHFNRYFGIRPHPDQDEGWAGDLQKIEKGRRLWAVEVVWGAVGFVIAVLVAEIPTVVRFFWNPDSQKTVNPGAVEPSVNLSGTALLLTLPVLILLTILAQRWWWKARAHGFLMRRETREEPLLERMPVERAAADLFGGAAFSRVTRSLRQRIVAPWQELDVAATVENTVRQGGWLMPRFAARRVTPEYLALIDRIGYRDQQACWIDELLDLFEKSGVHITRYSFKADSRLCIPSRPDKPALTVRELHARYPDHRLLLFSDGAGLLSSLREGVEPWVAQLLRWKDRALLTPQPPEEWGPREGMLAEVLPVLPATVEGLAGLAAAFENGHSPRVPTEEVAVPFPEELRRRPLHWLSRNPPEPRLVESTLAEVARYLGEAGFYWLSACAVYPALDWNLTLTLGRSLRSGDGQALLEPGRLAALTRLPWFRHGSMPDWLRETLVAGLSPEQEASVRSALDALLLTALRGRPSGAWLEVAQEHPKTVSKLIQQILQTLPQEVSPDSPLQDHIFLEFMKRRPPRLGVELPRSLIRFLTGRSQKPKPAAAVAPVPDHLLVAVRHPRGLYVLFFSEMLERFSYYLMLAVFLFYVQEGLGWSSDQAASVYSNYVMSIYASHLFGGWAADKRLGYRRAVLLGGFLLIAGYLMFVFGSATMVYPALACLVIGNGLFKPNVSVMVGNFYWEGSPIKDRAYLIFYSGINVGALAAPLAAAVVRQWLGFSSVFALAAGSMVVSVLILSLARRHLEVGSSLESESPREIADVVAKRRWILALGLMFLIVIACWTLFSQSDRISDLWKGDDTEWNALHTLLVLLFAIPLIRVWRSFDHRGIEPTTLAKMGIGMGLTGVSFYILYFAVKSGGDFGQVSPWWLIATYSVISLAELMFAPMGLSLVSKVVPGRLRGRGMAMWFAALAIGSRLPLFDSLWYDWPHSTFFAVLGSGSLILTLIMYLLLNPLQKRLPPL